MNNRSRMNLTGPASWPEQIRARAAQLDSSQSAVINEVLTSLLRLQKLDPDKRDPATAEQEFDLLLKAFAALAGPRLPELLAYVADLVDGGGATRSPARDD